MGGRSPGPPSSFAAAPSTRPASFPTSARARRPTCSGGCSRTTRSAAREIALRLVLVRISLGPLERLEPLLPRRRLLPLALDRRLLVVLAALHVLEQALLHHLLLEGLESGLDLVVYHVDLQRPGSSNAESDLGAPAAPGRCGPPTLPSNSISGL